MVATNVTVSHCHRYAPLCAVIAILAGCGGSQAPIGQPGILPQADIANNASTQFVYVANQVRSSSGWASSINIYRATANGNVPASDRISGSLTQLGEVNGIVVNRSGEIYVVDTDRDALLGFAPGAHGDAAPNVVISGSQTNLAHPIGLGIDSSGNLYVANCASGCGYGSAPSAVLEFSAESRGNVAPIRNISGPATRLTNPSGAAVDAQEKMYISNSKANTVDVFSANANGNSRPYREIAGSRTLLKSPDGIAVSPEWLYAGSAADDSVERFHRTAGGDVRPVAVISGEKTDLANVDGLATSHGVIYAASKRNHRIEEFTALANGDVVPIAKIAGRRTRLVMPSFVFVK